MGSEGDRRPPGGLRYRDAGVDIDAQDRALGRIRALVESTRTDGVLADLGAFGGLFAPDLSGLREPVLVASCDGVGTKLRIARLTGVHGTVGRDLVQHCVNDILVQGARPWFFLDYLATGRLDPGVMAEVVEGIAAGCRATGCALLGGETAEMPGFYGDGDYDVAGFVVGAVDRSRLLDGSRVAAGDRLLGLPSAGLHTNGFSLARKVFFDVAGLTVDSRVDELGASVGEVLLREHRCYLAALREPLDRGWVRGLAHVTGGGLTDNLPRTLPQGTAAEVERGSWPVPAEFGFLERRGGIDEAEMYRSFNMGIGMVVIAADDDVARIEKHWDDLGEPYHRIGRVVGGAGEVRYVGASG